MKLSAAQFNALHTLAEFGSKTAIEVVLPQRMDGMRKTKLEWNVATAPTLAKLSEHGLVSVTRKPLPVVRNAVGKAGNRRIELTISITDKGRLALNVASGH